MECRYVPHSFYPLPATCLFSLFNSRQQISHGVLTSFSNTGQILTSLAAEVVTNESTQPLGDLSSCVLLEEATGYFNRCFFVQQNEFAKFEEQIASADTAASSAQAGAPRDVSAEGEDADGMTSPDQGEKEEQWVSIREPVTRNDVLETILALVETLSILCSRSSRLGGSQAQKFLHTVEEIGTPTLLEQLSSLASLNEREIDGAIAQAGLLSAVSEAKYRLGFAGTNFEVSLAPISPYPITSANKLKQTYLANIQQSWSHLNLQDHAQGLWNRAEAYTTAAQAISDHDGEPSTASRTQLSQIIALQWEAYTLAAADLTTASKFRDDENIGKIFIARGDIELSRAALGRGEHSYDAARKNQGILMGNAEKYYRGAKVLMEGTGVEEWEEACVKEAVVKGLLGDSDVLRAVRARFTRTDEILKDAVNDGILDEDLMGTLISG